MFGSNERLLPSPKLANNENISSLNLGTQTHRISSKQHPCIADESLRLAGLALINFYLNQVITGGGKKVDE